MAQFSSKYLQEKCFCFLKKVRYRALSLTWPASMQMYRNNRKYLHKKKVYLSQDTNMDVVSLFWNPIWPPRRHVNLLHSTLFVSAETRNKGKGVPRVSVRVSPGSPRIPGTRLRSFANAKVHLVSLAAFFLDVTQRSVAWHPKKRLLGRVRFTVCFKYQLERNRVLRQVTY